MTRVVHVGFQLDRAGRDPEALLEAWPTLSRVAGAAAAEGFDVTVVQAAARDASLRRDGVVYRFVAERPALRRGPPGTRPVRTSAPRLGAEVERLAPDLLHVHGLALPGHVRRLRERLPAARVLAQDHADRPPRPWRRWAAARGTRPYDAVAFTVREQAAPFFAAGALPRGLPVHEVLESSTDFRPGEPAAARRAAGVYGEPCLAWVGRLDANKDPLTVLEGLARAAPRLRDPHLWCCHREGPLLDAVWWRACGDRRLAGRVHLLGELPASGVERLLQAADGLVQGSRREGSGYAVLEALACGATPVVTDIAPLRRIVGEAGLLWRAGDPRSLADALVRLAGTPAGEGRARALARFQGALCWSAVGRELAAAYEGCLAGAGERPSRPRSAP